MKKKNISKIFCIIISCLLFILPVSSVSAKQFDTYKGPLKYEPKEERHEHDFTTYDMCECGEFVVHDFNSSLLFITNEELILREEPTKKSDLTNISLEKNSLVEISGITRNRGNNLWVKAENEEGEGYIFVENLRYAYDQNLVRFGQYILQASSNNEERLLSFIDLVRPGGIADIKVWLDPSSKGIEYCVEFSDGHIKTLTAEQIGNSNYGSLGYAIGFTEDELLYSGGIVNIIGNPLEVTNCIDSYCDTPEDVEAIQMGIEYAKQLGQ